MKNWFEKITAQLNALLAPRMQPIPIRSDEQRRLAEERRRRR
ncbi:PA1414 family protein [Pseudomonas fulva]|nr:PA1414 family protein [Pseudomonas fulva]